MTVSSSTTKVSLSANGTQHSFAYTYKIFADADLEVIVRTSAGAETVQTLNTNYIVTGAGNASGGNVLFKFNTGDASNAHHDASTDHRPADGTTVVIRRNLTLTQGTDYVENDPFPAAAHEDALDRLTMVTQQIQEEVDRSIKASTGNTFSGATFTLSASDRANKVFSFDSSGNLAVTQELGTFRGDFAASTAYAVRDLVKDTSTNNIFIVNEAHTSSGSQPLTTNANSAKYTLIVDAASATTSQTAAATSATAAASSATAAASSASTATTKASEASTSASSAATSLATFQGQYHGAASSDPTSNLDTGDLYFNTSSGMKVYNGSAFEDVKPTSSEQTNINTVAAANSNISALAASAVIADMALLADADVIADMNTLATSDIISDLNTLATSDIVTDMNLLATSANVTAMGLLGTSANVTAMGLLGTSAVVTDMGLLGTSAVVADMDLLATSANVTNMATLGASGVVSNIATVAGAVTNVNTVATNVSGVNSFAERYRVASSAPTSSLDVGDLYFDTTANELKVYKSSGWAAAGSTVNGTSARFTYNISGTPTSVTGADANGNTLAYDAGFIDVYLNGVRLSGADITITSGDTVTFASALADGDLVDIVAFGTFTVANITSTGALNSGSITSGFGNIDTGSSTITTTGAISGGALSGTSLDLNGGELILDSDGDTSITADTDDRVDIKVAGSDKVHVTSTGLGIGTTSPATKLSLVSDGAGGDIHVKNGSGQNALIELAGNNNTCGSTSMLLGQTSDGTANLFNRANGNLVFGTNNTERMRIDSSGNVGVGTTSPTNVSGVPDLTVAGKFFTSDGTASNPAHSFTDDTNTGIFKPSADNLSFSTGGSERMRIDSSGNLGLGSTSPPNFGSGFTSLQVNDTSSGVVQANNSTNSVTTEIEAEGTRGAVGTRTNHDFVIKTNQTEAMRINSSGAVMIGTTSSPNNAPLLINCATDKNIRINQETHASVQAVNDAANAIVNLKLDGNDLLLNTQASGNVGINRTPASTIKLDVETSGSNHPARFKSDNVSFGTIFDNVAGSGNRFFCDFRINNSTKGKIFSDGSTTTYSQSSDYRLKENVVTDWDATTRLKQLKPSRFNFKEDKDTTYDGFLAHEVSSIVPEAVDGEKMP